MRLYRGLLPVCWREAIAYRGHVWLNVLSLVFPLLMMWVWLAIAQQSGGTVNGLRPAYFVSYYAAAAIIAQMTVATTPNGWDELVRLGGLSAHLLRPCDPGHQLFCAEVCRRALAGVLGLPLLAVVLVASHSVGSPGAVLLAVPAIVLGFVLNFLMTSAIGMLAFWLTQVQRIAQLWTGAGFVLAGVVAPLRTMPGWVGALASALPFKAIVGTPADLLAGGVGVEEGLGAMASGAAWTVLAFAVYRVLWYRGLRHYSAMGA